MTNGMFGLGFFVYRQLKFFTGDYSSGQLTRWPSGGDLVKASIHKLSVFKGRTTQASGV